MKSIEMDYQLIYIPPESDSPPIESSIGVKFCEDMFISDVLLDKWKVGYIEEDLEITPLGKALRLKK